jgi:hypothetical protein
MNALYNIHSMIWALLSNLQLARSLTLKTGDRTST